MKKKFSTILVLMTLCFVAMSQSCNNPLQRIFGLDVLQQPQSITGAKFCKSLKNGNSCCSAETINSFQDRSEQLASRLREIVIARDLYMVNIRNNVIPTLQTSLNKLKLAAVNALSMIDRGITWRVQNGQGNNPYSNQPFNPYYGFDGTNEGSGSSYNYGSGNYYQPYYGSGNYQPYNYYNYGYNNNPENCDVEDSDDDNGSGNYQPYYGSGNYQPYYGSGNYQPYYGSGNYHPYYGSGNYQSYSPYSYGSGSYPYGNGYGSYNFYPENYSNGFGFNSATRLIIQSLSFMMSQLTDQLPLLKTNFNTYQTSRATCIVEMVKLQAAAWCLSCDPEYSLKGADSSGYIQFSTELQQRLNSACYQYLSSSNDQNVLLLVNTLSSRLEAFSNSLDQISNNDLSGFTNLHTALDELYNPSPLATSQQPASLPSTCTSTNCEFIWTSIFSQGKINENILAAGGQLSSQQNGVSIASFLVSGNRSLRKDSESIVRRKLSRRNLNSIGWNPDSDEAGIEIKFEIDPANVGNENKASPNSGTLLNGLLSVIGIAIIMFI